jgi:glycerol-3-phosphate O-acyltransferase
MIPATSDKSTYHFFKYAKKMMANSKMTEDNKITPENVYQQAHKVNRDLLFEAVQIAHLPGSTILGKENISKLYQLAQEGKSCLILSEHLSNLDVPNMFVRFYEESDDKLKDIFENIIFVSGVKLNENQLVKLYTEMFSRVVIFPAKSIEKLIPDNEQNKQKIDLAKKINLRALRKIKELRSQGFLFLMFPSGTRFRPWDPTNSKKPIKETASYLNSFDYFCCCSINGNNMVPKKHEDMTREKFVKDVITFNFGEVQKTKDYLKTLMNHQTLTDKEQVKESKQLIGDDITNQIDRLHEHAEIYRKKYLKN